MLRLNLPLLSLSLLVSEYREELPTNLMVSEFREQLPTNLFGMPPDKDINFCIDLKLANLPISILPYRITLAELRELKA